ncbi:MAG: helix-turn-helix domain-containing protein [Chryseolinea sp.]
MRKLTSTNAQNEANMVRNCGMVYALTIIGGRWKPAILFSLLTRKMRYNELLKSISGISERMLVAQLRELEEHGMVNRIIYPEVPPRVEYELTEMGLSAGPLVKAISKWGLSMKEQNEKAMAFSTEASPHR